MNKRKTSILAILLVLVTVLTNSHIFAQSKEGTMQARHNAAFTPPSYSWSEYLGWMLPERGRDYYEKAIEKKNEEMDNLALSVKEKMEESKDILTLPIPKYTQINGYYCVPAAVQNVIHGIKDESPSQISLDQNMWTDSTRGTNASNAADELRYQTDYNYQVGVVSDQPFYRHLKTDLYSGHPVILFVRYSLYSPGKLDYGHAVVCYGYDPADDSFLCFDVLTGTSSWKYINTLESATFYYIY